MVGGRLISSLPLRASPAPPPPPQVVRPAERAAEPGGAAAAAVPINDAALTELCRKLDLSRDEVGGGWGRVGAGGGG